MKFEDEKWESEDAKKHFTWIMEELVNGKYHQNISGDVIYNAKGQCIVNFLVTWPDASTSAHEYHYEKYDKKITWDAKNFVDLPKGLTPLNLKGN